MRARGGRIAYLALATLIAGAPGAASAQSYEGGERITSFADMDEIEPDSTLNVTEAIDVIAEGLQIRHGIYRDFPTRYRDAHGNMITVGFDVRGVWRDGQAVSYRLQAQGDGERVYMGGAGDQIAPGAHRYILQYRTDHQLGYFQDFDELYWNVTGNGWVFPIDRASAAVTLPPGASLTQQSAYTGPAGAQGRDYTVSQGTDKDGRTVVTFVTTRPLGPHEGLTVAVAWPKGLVSKPKPALHFDRRTMIAGGAALYALVLFFYGFAWAKFGRGPRKGPIIPLFAAPEGFSPGEVGHLHQKFGGGDNRAFSASLVNMAVKRYIKIAQYDEGFFGKGFMLQKTGAPVSPLATEERVIAAAIIEPLSEFRLSKHNPVLAGVFADYQTDLTQRYDHVYYNYNVNLIAIGAIASLVCIVPFVMAGLFVPAIFVLVLTNIAGAKMLKAPNAEGRKLLDQIEGFKMYLATAEKERLNMFTPPQMTPEIFEKFLPYAMALGVENKWGGQFAAIVASGMYTNYAPVWYAGNAWNIGNIAGFTSAFADQFGGAIASSMAPPPGSSMGSDGGGSSGGGGGGGGGGGF